MAVTAYERNETMLTRMNTARRAPAQPHGVAECGDVEDAILIGRIAVRDLEAFTLLYQRYAARLAGFLHPQLATPALVDEVLHETLLVVWQDAVRFRGQAQLSTWIFRIAQRKAHQARAADRRACACPGLPPAAAPESPEALLLQQERLHAVHHCLAALAPAQRTVLELAYAHGWPLPAIAAHLGCSVSTVKTRLHQARRGLADRLTRAELAPERAV
jgi:RNA polymerase sigma-70 factor (ECF subfamily)